MRALRLIAVEALTLTLLLLVAYALAPAPQAAFAANEWHVCKSGGADFTTIQAAVNAAAPNDVIKVAAGVYIEVRPLGVVTANLYISKTIHLFGGYTCANWATQNVTGNVTIIRPFTPDTSVVALAGSFGNGATFTPTLDGFTISGGGGGNHGGGIRATDSNPLIRNNIITGNIGYLLGGGIWVQRGAPRIESNRIEHNIVTSGGSGGGVELEDSQATLSGNIVAGNVISDSSGRGGGISVDGGGPVVLMGNTLVSNMAAVLTGGVGYGGGVYASNVTMTLSSNVIESNSANGAFASGFGGAFGYGGGVYIVNVAAFTLTANTITTNTAGYKYGLSLSGGGVQIDSSQGTLSDNVIAANNANGNSGFGNGGGVAVYTSTLTIHGGQVVNNRVSINNCDGNGGGIYASNSSVTLDATRLDNNCAANTPAAGQGGGLAFVNSPYTLTNALIVNNQSFGNDTAVGGLYAGANSPGLVVNNTFANNLGQGIRTASPLTLTNNIIVSHTTGVSLTAAAPLSVTFNDFYNNATNQRGFSLGVTNIVTNPQLGTTWHLLPASPLIDAGTRTNAPGHDLDNQPRPMLGTSGLFKFDIGADEFTGVAQVNRDLTTQPADFTLIGPGNPQDNPNSTGSNDWIGYALLGGDINGDNRADLIVGAPNLSGDFDGGVNDDGRVFALYNSGVRRLGVVDLFTSTASLAVRSWLHQQHIGQSFAAADLDGDGQHDLIIGAAGAANFNVTGTVFMFAGGSSLSGVRTLSPTMQAAYRIRSDQNTSSFGGANALVAGQLNGTGPDDLAVAEAGATVAGRASAGAIYVFFGGNSLPALWDMRVLSPSLTIEGPAANAQLGKVAIADVNGDGNPDLIARSATTVYVFYGPLSPGVIDLAATAASLTIGGLSDGPLAAGDVDGDGKADIVAGSGNQVRVIRGSTGTTLATFTGMNASALRSFDWNGDGKAEVVIGDRAQNRAYVVFGSALLSGVSDIADSANWIISGENPGDQFGFSLGSADLDADGVPDLIVGSRSHSVSDHPLHFDDAGAVYVFYGQAPPKVYLPLIIR